ncbi:low-specificity L-threonine aldolase [Desulforhopalus sp. IMCC35007]|uniref:low-specificity L-threonine aldolase n=1 Tax=Desulforhopalus sp. IMCC35007 TaxID=2569543 RepID=UPI0010AE6CA6|nr:low-specificity L-threonine aldolase [Desulforhopalus sp. IMCC35007]
MIDLRSDTVTRPSEQMRAIMVEAQVGDDVYGDDPSVNFLQEKIARLTGFESALFTASGTQANLIGIMSHCERGDEYIVGQQAHTYRYEAGGAAVLGSIQPQPIEYEADSTIDLSKVEEKIKPDDVHFARTRLLCLENTQNGKALPLSYLKEASDFCKRHSLKLHLDGARLFNAASEQKVEAKTITSHFDSTSICLSKGLGAPVGSVLCGSKAFIEKAKRWRKMVGGGMRQAGILAAAGSYALDHNLTRLQEDHDHARRLAEGLRQIPGVAVTSVATNMVFFQVPTSTTEALAQHLKDHGILISPGKTTRLVTHLDVSGDDIVYVLDTIATFYN